MKNGFMIFTILQWFFKIDACLFIQAFCKTVMLEETGLFVLFFYYFEFLSNHQTL